MDRDLWRRVKEVFWTASALPGNERSAFLEEACQGDPALRAEVERLLAYEGTASRLVEAPVLGIASALLAQGQADAGLAGHCDGGEMIGKTVTHYRVVERLGAGGMGVVYKAQDIRLGRFVALKFISAPAAAASSSGFSVRSTRYTSNAIERFRREARAASALDHPNICTIHEVDEYGDSPFIVMQFLAGHTLEHEINGRPLAPDRLLDLGVQIADGLAAAHATGIVHRDIKPGNIFITQRGEAKILDFGLAKLVHGPSELPPASVPPDGSLELSSEPTLTHAGILPGTTAYMSPEQVRGDEADHRSDLFSLGAVLYEMATGIQPFRGETTQAIFHNILHHTPTLPSRLNHNISQAQERVIVKALEKSPDVRYQTAAAVRDDLKGLKLISDSSLLPVSRPTPRRWTWAMAGALLLLIVATIGAYWYRHQQPRLTEPQTILLADFVNTTGEPVFDHTLKQALQVQLEQSPFLDILSQDKVRKELRLMTRPANTPLTQEVAREVCLRAGGKAMLEGSIAPLGSHYVIGLDAVNCLNGDRLDTEQTEAPSRETVLHAVDEAAIKVRHKLGESLASIQKYATPIAQTTTSSLEALQAYSVGLHTRTTAGDAASVPFFKRAAELDPHFAMAYAMLGTAYTDLGETRNATAALTTAHELRERTSIEPEQLYIDFLYYMQVTGECEKAIPVLLQWEHAHPRQMQPHANLAYVYANLGMHQKALEELQAAFRLNSDPGPIYRSLALAYLYVNDFAQARNVMQRAEARQVPGWSADILYALAFLRGDASDMERQLKAAMGQPDSEASLLSLQAETEAHYGRLTKAREFTKKASALARSSGDPEAASSFQVGEAIDEAAFGYPAYARHRIGAALAQHPSRTVQTLAALAFALAGDPRSATRIALELHRQFPLDTLLNNYWLPTIRAASELDRGNPSRAIELLQTTTAYDLATPESIAQRLYPVYVRGLAMLAAGQGQQAAGEFQKILDHPGILLNLPLSSLARLGLARSLALEANLPARFTNRQALRGAGNAAVDADKLHSARLAYESLFAVWKDADRDLPILQQARKEYETIRPGYPEESAAGVPGARQRISQ